MTGVQASAAKAKGRPLTPLNRPRRIIIETHDSGAPAAVRLGNGRFAVESVVESWRIDDEWWREKTISRLYRRVLLEDGRVVDVYEDLVSGKWWRQAY